MSSCFSHGRTHVWVSNGTAQTLERAWLEALAELGIDKSDAAEPLIELLTENLEMAGLGMYGFTIGHERHELQAPETRRLLARAVEHVLARTVHAMLASQRTDPLLGFVRELDGHFRQYWLQSQIDIHGLLRESFGGDHPPVELTLQAPLRSALRALDLQPAIEESARIREQRGADSVLLRRELALRREQCERMAEAAIYFDPDYRNRALQALAEVAAAAEAHELAAARLGVIAACSNHKQQADGDSCNPNPFRASHLPPSSR